MGDIAFMPSNRNSWAWIVRQLLQHRRTVVTAVFLVGVLLSVGVLLGDWRRMRLEVEEAFRNDAAEEFGTLRQEIDEAVNSAASVADFFQTVGSVDQQKFQEFVVPHLTRAPGLLSLVWAPRVPDGSRGRFEAECRLKWGTSLGIFEGDGREQARAAGRRPEYFPVYYRESLTGSDNSQIVGNALGGVSTHLEALQRARDTGRPAMTASLPLIDGGDGVLVYYAIYRRGAPRDTVEERRNSLRGIVGAVFRIDQLVESSLKELSARRIDIRLFDEGASAADRLLYSRPSPPKKPRWSWFGQRLLEAQIRSGLQWTSSLDLGGRRWSASITPSAEYVSARVGSKMWANIVLGLVATGLVGGYLLVLMRRTDEVERLVASRTQELQQAHHRLLAEVGERTRAETVARRLTQQALSVQEEERQRLSRELHDEAGQSLTGLVLNLQLLDAEVPKDQASLRRRLREAGALARGTAERIRLLARGLRPPALDTLGLNASLRGLCHEVARRTGLAIEYTGSDVSPLPDAVSICLYRVLQEALTNVAKHACAGQVRVVLQDDAETVILSVEDDGLGFDTRGVIPPRNSSGIGLLGMQERLDLLDGRLEIVSQPGRGTRVTAHVPVAEADSFVSTPSGSPEVSR
ncbi:MAG TPA: CHASE domain-containing protein [Candidatus Acidoferrum sp.]|nr:CHASE domain-containing protein [Candidatus Acidoferrum sp.]